MNMSSYNNIEKIRYASEDCVVTLQEYIVFENEREREKYVVFKFSNNVSQQLLGMEFEVSQYDTDGNLIEKSVVIYNKFLSKPNSSFVPNAKLKVNFAFKTLSVRLVKAAFDRFLWKEGEFLDNSYKFEHYAADRDKEQPVKPAQASQPAVTYVKPQKSGRGALPFKAKNATRKNVPRFPGIFNFLICALVIAAIGVSIYLFTLKTTGFTLDNFDVKVINENDKTVAITGYAGEETDLVIPATVGEYSVIRINADAFKNSKIETVTIEASAYIESNAFSGCENLKTVASDKNLSVTENAFINCTSLVTVNLSCSYLYSGSLTGCTGVKVVIFDSTQAKTLKALFGGTAPSGVTVFSAQTLPDGFYN